MQTVIIYIHTHNVILKISVANLIVTNKCHKVITIINVLYYRLLAILTCVCGAIVVLICVMILYVGLYFDDLYNFCFAVSIIVTD